MPILLQVNVTLNWGSTGRIAESCNKYAASRGWTCYSVYGRSGNSSAFNSYKVGSTFGVYEHYAENKLFDNEGLASRSATKGLIKTIKRIKPDIIHLHNIHDHWLNYEILFKYLNTTDIKIVWTFHDFWAITGHCAHFVWTGCSQWLSNCEKCPCTEGGLLPLIKKSRRNFELKRRLFTGNHNLHIVSVSEWVGENVRKSFLKDVDQRVIPNGVDVNIFKPTTLDSIQSSSVADLIKPLEDKYIIMAVSSQWTDGNKGLEDYFKLSEMLKYDECIVLVGVSESLSKTFPHNIIGIQRTNNQQELAALYTRANVIVSFSSAETFGLTIAEGMACGTPAVVYDNTAQPFIISEGTGFVVPDGAYMEAYEKISTIKREGKKIFSERCREAIMSKYANDLSYRRYVDLYEEILGTESCCWRYGCDTCRTLARHQGDNRTDLH